MKRSIASGSVVASVFAGAMVLAPGVQAQSISGTSARARVSPVAEFFRLPPDAMRIALNDTRSPAAESDANASSNATASARGSAVVRGAQQSGDAAQARAEFERGVALADRLQWAEASEAFERSYAIMPRPGTLRNLGLSHRALGRYLRAIDEIERFLREGNPDADTRQQMQDAVNEMRQQLASVTVNVTPTDATITLDDRQISAGNSVQADPGRHVVSGRAAGHTANAQTITLGRGESRTVDLRLDRQGGSVLASPWFWIPIGLVIAGGVTAAILVATAREAPPDCGSLNVCATPR